MDFDLLYLNPKIRNCYLYTITTTVERFLSVNLKPLVYLAS